ncbi:MAG: hypothetical protein ACXW1U_16465 [Methylobacter sp.]
MTYSVNCSSSDCPKNQTCHRFMAEPKENQVYEAFKWRTHTEEKFAPGGKRKKEPLIVFGCSEFYSMPNGRETYDAEIG